MPPIATTRRAQLSTDIPSLMWHTSRLEAYRWTAVPLGNRRSPNWNAFDGEDLAESLGTTLVPLLI
jgi:hypothetical protein